MDRIQAEKLIAETFKNRFDKNTFRRFIINLLDGINEDKAFSIGNAQVKEAFRKNILSYQRIGQYTDKNRNITDVLSVHVSKDCSLDRNRTMLRNFVVEYMKQRGREYVLAAFYSDNKPDWRFSYIRLDSKLSQDDKGRFKVIEEFSSAKRLSFLVGENEPNHTAQASLIPLLIKDYPAIAEIQEAFNVERVSKEFFDNYKELFLQLADNLKEIRRNDERINYEFTLKSITEANFCKKLLGQLVFLYFIQKKGWLGVPAGESWGRGDKQFLRHTFERAVREGKNFFNDYLEPLFYNALANGARKEQYFELLDCKIPFLNGGLFEPVCEYDWVNTDIVFENDIFSNTKKNKAGDTGTGILDVFDRYNFTVKEDEPLEKEVAIDPEMLGKVFENLLEVVDRKSKGAFYTPREIVHYMCRESLINYLCSELDAKDNTKDDITSNNLTRQAVENFIYHSDEFTQTEAVAVEKENKNSVYVGKFEKSIKDNADRIDKALENIKICDPAIGSGAFPVGILNEIVRARLSLAESGYLKETKKHSVYEYKRQAIQNSIYGVDIESGAVEIAKLRLWLSLVVDEEDIKNIKPLPNLDYKIVCGNSLLNVKRNLFNNNLIQQLEELKPQFFNETRKSEKRMLKKQIDGIIKELTKDGTFDFEIYFSEVFHENGGFDVAIGNPPYIQLQNFKGNPIQNVYKNAGYKVYDSKGDIYCLFYEKGINLLKNNGNLCFITSNKWMRAGYGEKLREFFVKNNPVQLVDFGGFGVFDSATVDVNILIIEKNKYENKTKSCAMGKDFNKLNQMNVYIKQNSADQSYNKDTWCILNPVEQGIKEKIERIGTPLKEWDININYGIKTGLNEAFIIDGAKKDELIAKDPKSAEIIRPILRGRDIQRYSYNFADKWLIATFPSRHYNIDDYPAVRDYLLTFDKRVLAQTGEKDIDGIKGKNARSKTYNKWFEMQSNISYWRDFDSQIIAWQRITQKPTFCIPPAGSLVLDSMAFLSNIGKYKYWLLAVLNSDLIYFWAKINVHEYGNTGFRLSNQYVEQISVPQISDEHIKIIDSLVLKQIEEYNPDIEKEIQKFVFEIYEISDYEIQIIHSKINENNKEII